jgi:single-strand DNA-binding protein
MLTTQIVTAGNLAEPPKLAWTPRGLAVLTMTILVSHNRRDEQGNWTQEMPTRHRVKAFGPLAEHAADSLHTGDRITVIGTQRAERWHDPATKEPRTTVWVYADEIGASLTFATVTIQRTTRRPATDEPAAQPAPAMAPAAA